MFSDIICVLLIFDVFFMPKPFPQLLSKKIPPRLLIIITKFLKSARAKIILFIDRGSWSVYIWIWSQTGVRLGLYPSLQLFAHSVFARTQESYCSSLSLSFLICKMGKQQYQHNKLLSTVYPLHLSYYHHPKHILMKRKADYFNPENEKSISLN